MIEFDNIFNGDTDFGKKKQIQVRRDGEMWIPFPNYIITIRNELTDLHKITSKPKLIDINNSICPIVIDKINQNEYYMSCDICKNNFSFDAINEWFKTKSHDSICPMCKSNWSNKNIYINSNDVKTNN